MGAQGFQRLLDIHLPVAQAVEGVSQGNRIVHATCQRKSLLTIGTRLDVIALRPQKAQVHQSLPLTQAVASDAGQLQRGLIIQAGPLKVPQLLVGLSTQAIEQSKERNRSLLSGIQSASKLFYGGTRRVHGLCLLSGTLPILQRLLPCTRLVEV